jgi:Skp family chaperone for outer membrane proteins
LENCTLSIGKKLEPYKCTEADLAKTIADSFVPVERKQALDAIFRQYSNEVNKLAEELSQKVRNWAAGA